MNDILESAGLRNLAAGASSPWPQLSEEFLLQEDPEILVLIGDPADHAKIMSELRAHPVRRHLRAVREDRVVVFPAAALIVPGPRALEAAAKLRALLPPP